MSVLIKGMDMPKSCERCIITAKGQYAKYCVITGLSCINNERQKDCPLVEVPSADVHPVVHGEWIPFLLEYRDMFRCSKCKVIVRLPFKTDQMPYEFCPGCGARMGGET